MLDYTKNKVAALPSLTRETDPFEAEGLTVINPWLAQQFDLLRFALEWSVTGDHTMAIFDETRNANILNCQLAVASSTRVLPLADRLTRTTFPDPGTATGLLKEKNGFSEMNPVKSTRTLRG